MPAMVNATGKPHRISKKINMKSINPSMLLCFPGLIFQEREVVSYLLNGFY